MHGIERDVQQKIFCRVIRVLYTPGKLLRGEVTGLLIFRALPDHGPSIFRPL